MIDKQVPLTDAEITEVWKGLGFRTKWAKYLLTFARAVIARAAPPAQPTAQAGAEPNIQWIDEWGCENKVSTEFAAQTLKAFFDAWPGGLDEIESSVSSWRERALKVQASAEPVARAIAQSDGACEARDAERLVWVMRHTDCMHLFGDFEVHVIKVGGTGDVGDCRAFIDAAIAASAAKGEK